MVLGLWTQDFDSECGIREGFFHDADEFNDVLRHNDKYGKWTRKSRGILQITGRSINPKRWISVQMKYLMLQNSVNIVLFHYNSLKKAIWVN